MIRLLFLAASFGGGLIVGLSTQQDALDRRCVAAGGIVGAQDICEGVPIHD